MGINKQDTVGRIYQNVSQNIILAGRDFKVNDHTHTEGVVNSRQKRKRKAGVSDGQHITKPQNSTIYNVSYC